MVACDVAVPPEAVVRIAAAFNAKLFTPNNDLREAEKKLLASRWRFANVHEMDAAAGAVKALNFYGNVLRKVERVAREKGLGDRLEELQSLVLSGVRIEDAAESFVERKLEYEIVEKGGGARKLAEELSRKDERVRGLLGTVAELRKALERQEAEARELREKIKSAERGVLEKAKRDAEVRRRDAEILRLRNIIFKVKEARRLELQARAKVREEKEKVDLDRMVEEHRASRKHL